MKIGRTLLCILLLGIMCFSVVGGVIVANKFKIMINPSLTDDGTEIDGDLVIGNRINILVIGTDKSSALTDTIVLFQVNTADKTIKALSIPRDTRVLVKKSYYKINNVYSFAGKKEQNLMDQVRGLTALPIHYYVTVGLEGFRNIVDFLGGVDIDVKKPMNYNDPAQNLSIHIAAGFQHMNGKTAEGYVRYRHNYVNGDIDRVKIQQEFIKEFIKQKLTLSNIMNAKEIFTVLKEYITTNFSISEVVGIVNKLKGTDTSAIKTFSLPGEPQTINDVSYWIAHPEEIKALINAEFK